ncbi:MAG: hypothetical protein LBB88_10785 [Planctomycetaceae bacterium]|jgi:hypothetical protein|nr:hypothetical protein [Planctomycetaceae bacterium]
MKRLFILLTIAFFGLNQCALFAQQKIEQLPQSENISQTKVKFTPLGEKFLKNNNIVFDAKKGIRHDVILFSKYPNGRRIEFEESSRIFDYLQIRLDAILNPQFIPDRNFFVKNSLFYTIAPNNDAVDKNNEERFKRKLSCGYDIAYIPYKIDDDIYIIVAVTNDVFYGATYIYIQLPDKIQEQKKYLEILKKLMLPEMFKIIVIANNKTDLQFNDPVIPIFEGGNNSLCCIRMMYFKDNLPARGALFSSWFELRKKNDIEALKEQKIYDLSSKYELTRQKQCDEFIKTPEGRSKLIALIASEEGKTDFTEQYKYFYVSLRQMPYDTLLKYYKERYSTNRFNRFSAWSDEFTSSMENKALSDLLKSTDVEVKTRAFNLIFWANARSLLPVLLEMTKEKDLLRDDFPKNEQHKTYNFYVFGSIGVLGDARTLRELKKFQKTNISDDVRNDVELAIIRIQDNIDEDNKIKKSMADNGLLVREKKMIMIGGDMSEYQKPVPESISKDGFRKWETSDGLFKTTAKFVGLKEIKDKTNKIIDKDIQLLRNDNKTVAIELSALRLIDREHIRQQFEPEREWISTDKNVELKLKAKILGKFEKEIIVQESDGINTTLKIESLAESDKEYLKSIPLSPHSKYVF